MPRPRLDDVIFGLVDATGVIADSSLARRCRDWTLSWSRFCFHGTLLEDPDVDSILARAHARGARYCILQWSGHLIHPNGLPIESEVVDFATAFRRWADATDFLIAGAIVGDARSWFGFAPGCVVVDLVRHQALGAPTFGGPTEIPTLLTCPSVTAVDGNITALTGTPRRTATTPRYQGWGLIEAALAQELTVVSLPPSVVRHTVDLASYRPAHRRALTRHHGAAIADFAPDHHPDLAPDTKRFLQSIQSQVARSRNAVGLWNIESYDDIEPPAGFTGPLANLYAVAQGFKPNIILERLGFDADTRIVFFDYSQQALAIRRCIVEEWDGVDFPGFVRHLFEVFPDPDTHYYLWRGLRPREIDWADMEQLWQRELAAWGGARIFGNHWRGYRSLHHTYVHCNLLAEPDDVLAHVAPTGAAAVWWSNAFFTMYANWHANINERRQMYERWIVGLSQRNPDLCLFGSDHVNNSVNNAQARAYWRQFRKHDRDGLEPITLHSRQISM